MGPEYFSAASSSRCQLSGLGALFSLSSFGRLRGGLKMQENQTVLWHFLAVAHPLRTSSTRLFPCPIACLSHFLVNARRCRHRLVLVVYKWNAIVCCGLLAAEVILCSCCWHRCPSLLIRQLERDGCSVREGDGETDCPGALSHNDKLLRWWLRLMDVWDYFAGPQEEELSNMFCSLCPGTGSLR